MMTKRMLLFELKEKNKLRFDSKYTVFIQLKIERTQKRGESKKSFYMYNQWVLFVESVVAVDDVRLIAFACCNNSTNLVLSTVVEPNSACATSGII